MDFYTYFDFGTKQLLFSIVVIITAFVLAWLLYNNFVIKKINLKDALFAKDNIAAWIEFTGAFLMPVLFLTGKAVEGSMSEILVYDLGISTAYALSYVVLLILLRMGSGLIISLIKDSSSDKRIDFNDEIFAQKNIAASMFSIALAIIFSSMIRFLDLRWPDYFLESIVKQLNILVFTLIAVTLYSIILRKKTTLFKEIFIENNAAAGISFTGFIFAVEIILTNVIYLQQFVDIAQLFIMSGVSLAVFGLLSVCFKWFFSKIIKIDVWKEVYDQNNIGAAFGQITLYIGVAIVITHFIR